MNAHVWCLVSVHCLHMCVFINLLPPSLPYVCQVPGARHWAVSQTHALTSRDMTTDAHKKHIHIHKNMPKHSTLKMFNLAWRLKVLLVSKKDFCVSFLTREIMALLGWRPARPAIPGRRRVRNETQKSTFLTNGTLKQQLSYKKK